MDVRYTDKSRYFEITEFFALERLQEEAKRSFILRMSTNLFAKLFAKLFIRIHLWFRSHFSVFQSAHVSKNAPSLR